MGCDIHAFIEIYDQEEKEWGCHSSPGIWRNYSLFSVLADVRNGYGFAACDTGDRMNPIDDPRGLPDDVSMVINDDYESWGCDAHSASYLSLRELLDYDWDQMSVERGIVSLGEYLAMKIEGRITPRSYCGGTNQNVISLEQFQKNVDHLIEPIKKLVGYNVLKTPEEKHEYIINAIRRILEVREQAKNCLMQWEESYRDLCEDFLENVVVGMEGLGDPDDVRLVFWFDN